MSRKQKPSTQKTLHDFLPVNTSPSQAPSSPTRRVKSRPIGRSQKPSKPIRARIVNSSDKERTPESSSDVEAIPFEPAVIEISDSEEEAKSSPRRPKTTRHLRRTQARSDDEARDSSDDSVEENVGIAVLWKGKGKAAQGKRKQVVDDSDNEQEIQPKRRKLVKGQRPPTPEVEDLMEELDEDKVLESRLRTRDKKSKYLQNLERMKRRKRGEQSLDTNYSKEDEEPSEDESAFRPFKHARPGSIISDSESDDEGDEAEEEEDTFIVEDDSAALLELPVEFSMSTYQELTHHFKVICQLFVHLAVQEKEDRAEFMEQMCKEQYFSVPLQIARRKIDGTRDSIVASSVWRNDYKKPLQTYPHFEVTRLDFTVPSCDACRLGGRISTLTGRLSGEPYDRQTFEPLRSRESSSVMSDSDSEDEDRKRPKKEFHLGRFCARRTRVFHEFTHWEYTLFQALAREVDDLRARTTKKKPGQRVYVPVAFAGGKKPPEDIKNADEVMAWLDSRQVIAREVARLKQMMESATNLEVASKRGEEDD